MTMKIDLKALAYGNACRGQMLGFINLFGAKEATYGVPCTRENVLKAAQQGLDVWWAAINCFTQHEEWYAEQTNYKAYGAIQAKAHGLYTKIIKNITPEQNVEISKLNITKELYAEALALVELAKHIYDAIDNPEILKQPSNAETSPVPVSAADN